MRVDDAIRKTIVYVGLDGPSGFVPYGTGFFIKARMGDAVFQTVVTAKHVLDAFQGEIVSLRLNDRDGFARVIGLRRSSWLPHPDERVDLSVCPTRVPPEKFDILHLGEEADFLTDEIIAKHEIGIGDDILIAGMFVRALGEAGNIPIVRVGNIAAMEQKLETVYGYHDAYLVEARSIGGLSGSPVFLQLAPWRVNSGGLVKMTVGKTLFFMGVVLGHHPIRSTEENIQIKGPELTEAEEKRIEHVVPLNSGIAVVLPVRYVREAIDQPKLRKLRETALAEKKKREPFRGDSASPNAAAPSKYAPRSAPPLMTEGAAASQRAVSAAPDADNPRHKEDFTNLLRAAAKGRAQVRKTSKRGRGDN